MADICEAQAGGLKYRKEEQDKYCLLGSLDNLAKHAYLLGTINIIHEIMGTRCAHR